MGKFMFNLYLSMKCNVCLQVPIPLNGQGPFRTRLSRFIFFFCFCGFSGWTLDALSATYWLATRGHSLWLRVRQELARRIILWCQAQVILTDTKLKRAGVSTGFWWVRP